MKQNTMKQLVQRYDRWFWRLPMCVCLKTFFFRYTSKNCVSTGNMMIIKPKIIRGALTSQRNRSGNSLNSPVQGFPESDGVAAPSRQGWDVWRGPGNLQVGAKEQEIKVGKSGGMMDSVDGRCFHRIFHGDLMEFTGSQWDYNLP